jgi:transposase
MPLEYRADQSRIYLFPPAVEEWVPSDHPARFIRTMLESIDLPSIGIMGRTSREGHPSYHPRLLLSVWLYGYFQGLRSSRELERACYEQLGMIWLIDGYRPDHNTLWRFFRDHRSSLEHLLRTIAITSWKQGLSGTRLHAIDGTKIQARSSNRTGYHGQALGTEMEKIASQIARWTQEIDARQSEEDAIHGPDGGSYGLPAGLVDSEAAREKLRNAVQKELESVLTQDAPSQDALTQDAPSQDAPSQDSGSATVMPSTTGAKQTLSLHAMEQKRQHLESRLARCRQAAAELKAAHASHYHPVEPEARMMQMKGMTTHKAFGYNAQIVVDQKSGLVLETMLTDQESDYHHLIPIMEQVERTYGLTADSTIADAGYASHENFTAIATWEASHSGQTLRTAIPKHFGGEDHHGQGPGPYHHTAFQYDPETNQMTCPQQKVMPQLQLRDRVSKHGFAYTSKRFQCQDADRCPVRTECTSNRRGRLVDYQPTQPIIDTHLAALRDPKAQQQMALRKVIVEPAFARIKQMMNVRRFLRFGLPNVQAEWALVCITHNLRKLFHQWKRTSSFA